MKIDLHVHFRNSLRSIRKEDVAVSALNIDFAKSIDSTSKFYYGVEFIYNAVSSRAYKENSISLEGFSRKLQDIQMEVAPFPLEHFI